MKTTIVGCGLSGSVAARILCDKGWDVQVFENRSHIGGNCFDSILNNVLVHNYGPHTFHTDSDKVWKFINRFTKFNNFVFKVVANTNKCFVPIPFNKKTEELVGNLSDDEIKNLLFVDYSEKQWGMKWENIPEEIINRVPTRRENYDDRYFCDKFQGFPEFGFTKMFESLLKGIKITLNCDKDAWRKEKSDLIVYTGKLDEYFNFCFGELPYRSLRFEHVLTESRDLCTINECNKINTYTRSYDHRHWTLSQKTGQTIITYEYPCEHTKNNFPFYPIATKENLKIKKMYQNLAEKENNVVFIGRLANYKYLDMDDAIEHVMNIFG
jgi:UDP-galactopyranose mutase